jgi:hypothetical protein
MSFLDRFRSKKEDETSRILRLLHTGRIVDGNILDVVTDGDARIVQVTYNYTVDGVQYECSQELTPDQKQHSHKYVPGKQVIIRYDRQRPANSTIV